MSNYTSTVDDGFALRLGEREFNYHLDEQNMLTPALVIYPEIVRHNIRRMINLLGGDPRRWRPHLKTVKLPSIMRVLVTEGVTTAKCATTLELLVACEAGMNDVLVAYPHTGPNARRIAAIADQFPHVRVSAIVEAAEQVAAWEGKQVELFIDLNTGMNRTGIEHQHRDRVRDLALRIGKAGLTFRGLHFYDGHATEADPQERERLAHCRYDQLMALCAFLKESGIEIQQVITSGTPALPAAISYRAFWDGERAHQVSPGTTVYNDSSSLKQLPASFDLHPAVLVISRVVSHPTPGIITCDAGHKSVSVDSGVPNCTVLGHEELHPMKPSEEHLPLAMAASTAPPALGEPLYLLPRHVCPTVNNFDSAILAEAGKVSAIEPVSARGHEAPF